MLKNIWELEKITHSTFDFLFVLDLSMASVEHRGFEADALTANNEQQPPIIQQQPPNVEQQPPNVEQQPPNVEQPHVIIELPVLPITYRIYCGLFSGYNREVSLSLR